MSTIRITAVALLVLAVSIFMVAGTVSAKSVSSTATSSVGHSSTHASSVGTIGNVVSQANAVPGTATNLGRIGAHVNSFGVATGGSVPSAQSFGQITPNMFGRSGAFPAAVQSLGQITPNLFSNALVETSTIPGIVGSSSQNGPNLFSNAIVEVNFGAGRIDNVDSFGGQVGGVQSRVTEFGGTVTSTGTI
ncbi:MAG TPA: hypothetical protein VK436_17360 [Methanocella sp.]|nr:hypothetical protein [Methanocella sp.]